MRAEEVDSTQEATAAKPSLDIDDPIAQFLGRWWQQGLYLLIGLGFLLYLYFGYQRSQEESRRQAADLYYKVRASLEEIEGVDKKLQALAKEGSADKGQDEEKRKELEAKRQVAEQEKKGALEKFQQRISALSDVREPYRSIASIYDGMNALRQGDLARARTKLGTLKWQTITDAESGERFLAELAALSLGRALIDYPESREEGIKLLSDLAERGVYSHSMAALSIARVALSPADRKSALALLEKLSLAHPEQSDLLRSEIERLRS